MRHTGHGGSRQFTDCGTQREKPQTGSCSPALIAKSQFPDTQFISIYCMLFPWRTYQHISCVLILAATNHSEKQIPLNRPLVTTVDVGSCRLVGRRQMPPYNVQRFFLWHFASPCCLASLINMHLNSLCSLKCSLKNSVPSDVYSFT